MIEVKNLSRNYGTKTAVDDLSFTVKQGEILGFLGPNGAGKSTTMNIITGYLSPSNGTATIEGFDVAKNPLKVKSQIGYLPEQPPLYLDMTVYEYLCFVYDLKKVKLNKKEHISEISELITLNDVRNKLIKTLSKGYKQRVGLAGALIGNPKVLILDEPTVGLDPKQIIETRALIKKLSKKHTIILSSHILSEIQAVCDRVIVIANGKLVADDTTANLSDSMTQGNRYTVTMQGDSSAILYAIKKIDDILSVKPVNVKDDICQYKVEAYVDVRAEIFRAAVNNGFVLLELTSNKLTLEEVFLQLTMQDGGNNDSNI